MAAEADLGERVRRFVGPGSRVLEVGAGPGRFTLELGAIDRAR